MRKIIVAAYREGPMEIVSGPEGKHRVHFEAPESSRLVDEMNAFLAWFNDDARRKDDWILSSAVAHLWFVTIHPFDDGNGRIARAISDMCLARADKSAQRFYSLSSQIRKERAEYYRMLESTEKGGIDITPWMEWFVGCTTRAINGSHATLATVFARATFWSKFARVEINERQRTMLNRLFDGFEGKLTRDKWMKMTGCTVSTAQRDIQDLVEKGALVKNPEGGRSTSYRLAEVTMAIKTPSS
jgi:Fic family protein